HDSEREIHRCRTQRSALPNKSRTAMAMYFFTSKFIQRSKGQSAVNAAAYRSASRMHDYRQDRTFDYTTKQDVIHSEILAPESSPEWVRKRELLWNRVEAREKRRDAQLAMEIE